MLRPTRTLKNKPQARTETTKVRILDAAQSAFAELGFENTQLDEVAARANCSRGAIYAHYSSKEAVFLELMEQRVHAKFAAMRKQLEDEPDFIKRPGIFKRWILSQVGDPEWGTLTLEFELYAVRRPALRDRLSSTYEGLLRSPSKDLVEVLFGENLPKATRSSVERRLGVLGGAINGVILESRFRPALLSASHVRKYIGELFDALIHI